MPLWFDGSLRWNVRSSVNLLVGAEASALFWISGFSVVNNLSTVGREDFNDNYQIDLTINKIKLTKYVSQRKIQQINSMVGIYLISGF